MQIHTRVITWVRVAAIPLAAQQGIPQEYDPDEDWVSTRNPIRSALNIAAGRQVSKVYAWPLPLKGRQRVQWYGVGLALPPERPPLYIEVTIAGNQYTSDVYERQGGAYRKTGYWDHGLHQSD